jgi:hypothetical protein
MLQVHTPGSPKLLPFISPLQVDSSEPANITTALKLWEAILLNQIIAIELLYLSVDLPSEFSSIGFVYPGSGDLKRLAEVGESSSQFFSGCEDCAEDPFFIFVASQLSNISFVDWQYFYVLPTGHIELGDTLEIPNLDVPMFNTTESKLKLITWIITSTFWLALYDMGQIDSVCYATGETLSSGFSFNLSNSTFEDSTTNIFVNDTLFQVYSSYLREIVSSFGYFYDDSDLLPDAGFLPLNLSNRLQPVDTPIYQTYSCSRRQLKGTFSLIISVLASDYALLAALYTLVIYVGGLLQRRKDVRGAPAKRES